MIVGRCVPVLRCGYVGGTRYPNIDAAVADGATDNPTTHIMYWWRWADDPDLVLLEVRPTVARPSKHTHKSGSGKRTQGTSTRPAAAAAAAATAASTAVRSKQPTTPGAGVVTVWGGRKSSSAASSAQAEPDREFAAVGVTESSIALGTGARSMLDTLFSPPGPLRRRVGLPANGLAISLGSTIKAGSISAPNSATAAELRAARLVSGVTSPLGFQPAAATAAIVTASHTKAKAKATATATPRSRPRASTTATPARVSSADKDKENDAEASTIVVALSSGTHKRRARSKTQTSSSQPTREQVIQFFLSPTRTPQDVATSAAGAPIVDAAAAATASGRRNSQSAAPPKRSKSDSGAEALQVRTQNH
jgi:hypothetical protein